MGGSIICNPTQTHNSHSTQLNSTQLNSTQLTHSLRLTSPHSTAEDDHSQSAFGGWVGGLVPESSHCHSFIHSLSNERVRELGRFLPSSPSFLLPSSFFLLLSSSSFFRFRFFLVVSSSESPAACDVDWVGDLVWMDVRCSKFVFVVLYICRCMLPTLQHRTRYVVASWRRGPTLHTAHRGCDTVNP